MIDWNREIDQGSFGYHFWTIFKNVTIACIYFILMAVIMMAVS